MPAALAVEAFDEAYDASGRPRPHYDDLLCALAGRDLDLLARRVQERIDAAGCTFGDEPFVIDPVPRVLTATEWRELERGLAQRARALEAFARDVYGERRSVGSAIPERIVGGACYHEPRAEDIAPPHYIGLAGMDVVRCPDGCFRVLEDNVRTPSGVAYALAARRAVQSELDLPGCQDPEAPARELLRAALRSAAPASAADEPCVVLLSDGPGNSAGWEHERLGVLIGVPVVTADELVLDGDRVVRRTGDGREPVDVVYRRTDADRLRDPHGRPTPIGELLERPLQRGTVAMVTAAGAGVADDKLVYAYVPALIRELLGEEPLLEQIPTYDLLDADQRGAALEHVEELVVKPRDAYGGRGVVVCPDADEADVHAAARLIRDEPGDWIAQACVRMSVHPTVIDATLQPRHVDLRAFVAIAGGEVRAVPGGLSRVAFGDGALVVNSSQGGGAKDTVVLA